MGGPQLNGFDGDVGSMIVWLAMIGAYNDFLWVELWASIGGGCGCGCGCRLGGGEFPNGPERF